ncbi:divalent-cation tolerance protein CutA [bacterium]|nr:MAG: divalent-cation tolerance protein CutA [bacterium]
MTNLHFVYCTCSNKEEAQKIARDCVGKRLAACANIIDGMESVYWWEEKLIEDKETVLIFKTHENRILELTENIKKLHSYKVPCVISLPIVGGNHDYLKWILSETK